MVRAAMGLFQAATAALAAQPARIVAAAPSFAEKVFGLDSGARVAAVSTYFHALGGGGEVGARGRYLNPTVEAMAMWRPALALVHSEQKSVSE